MSVTVSVDVDEEKHKWYTSQEQIRGKVVLNLRSSVEVKAVLVSLYGISETSLTRIDDFGHKFTEEVEECSLILDLREQLFPPSGDEYATKYALREGTHSWPFTFVFPLHATNTDSRPLPPSLSDMDPDLASIRYFLRASVNYSSPISLIRSSHTSDCVLMKPIVFLPSDDSLLDELPTYGVLYSNRSSVVSSTKTVSGLFSRIVSTLAHDRVPTCTDVGLFTARSELLLTPGLKFSWSLEAQTPTREQLLVTGVSVTLLAKTHVRAKNLNKTVESRTVLLANTNLNLKEGDITSQLQSPSLVVPESTPPSFCSDNIKREYLLVFKLKWTHRPSSALTHKAYLSKKVFIRSGMHGLPGYDAGDIPRASRYFPQAKWYFKTP